MDFFLMVFMNTKCFSEAQSLKTKTKMKAKLHLAFKKTSRKVKTSKHIEFKINTTFLTF